jgi:endonuclease/exonuclease/phosphatase (EEP) superfamily protein YafD
MKRRFGKFTKFTLLMTAIFTVLGLVRFELLLIDLASHFKIQYLLIGALCCLVLLALRFYVTAAFASVVVALNAYFIVPWYEPAVPIEQAHSGHVKILMNNVYSGNRSPDSLMRLISEEEPDIVLLLETNQRWVNYMNEIEGTYTENVIQAREDNSGIALYSKMPIRSSEIRYFGLTKAPSIVATIESKQGKFDLIGTHPLPPVTPRFYQSRNSQLQALAEAASQWERPLILAGDLNTTMWSSHYELLESVGGLNNARDGFGMSATWPSHFAYLGIPIDHVLTSKHFVTNSFTVGPHTGSDHRPIITVLSFLDGS